MNSDLEMTLEALRAKLRPQRKAWDYYQGRHPLVFSSARLKQVFRRLDARFTLNWCGVVVDAAFDRIRLRQMDVAGDPSQSSRLNEMFRSTGLSLDSEEVHRSVLVAGESFVFAWKDDSEAPVEAFVHDASTCHVAYDPDHPRRKSFAARTWRGRDGHKLSLYYPETIQHYVNSSGNWGGGQWELEDEGDNLFGEVPAFHFRRDSRETGGDLVGLYELQDAVNKLLNDLMICSEFGVFAQRYVVSNADVGVLKNSPNEIWQIPAGDKADESTQVGQFEPMRLSNFLEPMAELASAMAILSRTPKHYFMRQGGDPSGEALSAMEAPLIHKVERLLDRLTPTWAELGRFLLRLEGIDVSASDVLPRFDPAHGVAPRLEAEIREMAVRAGIPLPVYLQRYEGWTPEELQLLKEDSHGV